MIKKMRKNVTWYDNARIGNCKFPAMLFKMGRLPTKFQALNCTAIPDNFWKYRQVSNISRTLVGNRIVDRSDVVGASPVGAAPITSEWSTI